MAEIWDTTELTAFFATATLPESIRLDRGTTIADVKLYVESHFAVLEQQNGNPTFRAYYDRLTQLKELLEAQSS